VGGAEVGVRRLVDFGEKVSAGKTLPGSEKARGRRGTIGAGPVFVSILDEVKVAQEIDVIRLCDPS